MVGGLFDENGISAFARPVLFGTAGDAMRDALPDAVEACFFAHDDREPAVAGAQDIALDAAIVLPRWLRCRRASTFWCWRLRLHWPRRTLCSDLAETHLNTGYGVSYCLPSSRA